MRSPTRFLAAAGIVLALAATSTAAVVNLGASNWNTLIESPTGALSNGGDDNIFAGLTNQLTIRRGLLKFNVAASVPAGSVINSVSLRLRMTRTLGGDEDIALHRVLKSWGQGSAVGAAGGGGGAAADNGSATWLHTFYNDQFWDTPGGDFEGGPSASIVVGAQGFYTWTGSGLVSDVQAWLDDPSVNHGWIAIGEEVISGGVKRFAAGNHATTTWRPVLTIDYTVIPSPGAGALALFGVALAARRRR